MRLTRLVPPTSYSVTVLLALTFFFFNDTATTEIYTLSLHDALPISELPAGLSVAGDGRTQDDVVIRIQDGASPRSEEHTSELQSRQYLVCRLLLEKKKKRTINMLASQNKSYTTRHHIVYSHRQHLHT